MASRSFLRGTSSPRKTPHRQTPAIATCPYAVPIGWMFLFADADRISYADPEDPRLQYFLFRAPLREAQSRLAAALAALRGSPYLWSRFEPLEELGLALARCERTFVELDLEEILRMGEPDDEFERQIRAAPARLPRFLSAASRGLAPEAMEAANALSQVSGLSLAGDPELDLRAWAHDLVLLRAPTPEALLGRWVRGEIEGP